MSDDLDLAQDLVSGKLDLLCPKMELLECPDYTTIVMSGSGVIRSNERGQLTFRLAGKFLHPIPSVLTNSKPDGSVYEFEDHVMLVATDAEGREWRSNPLLIKLRHPAEFLRNYINRPLNFLGHARKCISKNLNRITLYIPRNPAVPMDRATVTEHTPNNGRCSKKWSLDHHKRLITGTEFEFRKTEDDWLVVQGQRDSFIPCDWAGLMSHAISFAVGETIRPAVNVRCANGHEHLELVSGPFLKYHSLLTRPMNELGAEHADTFWGLVERFFLFSQQENTPIDLLTEIEAVRGGAAMPLPTAGLILAIGIEAIAKFVLPKSPPSGWDNSARSDLIEHLKEWTGDEHTKNRVISWLNSKGEPRVKDMLYSWATENGLSHELVVAWSKLRNSRAHGGQSLENQSSYDTYYAIVELFYRLIYWTIDYDGPLIETSKPGWGEESEIDSESRTHDQ